MRKVEHIGIAVKDLEKASKLYTALLGLLPYKQEKQNQNTKIPKPYVI